MHFMFTVSKKCDISNASWLGFYNLWNFHVFLAKSFGGHKIQVEDLNRT